MINNRSTQQYSLALLLILAMSGVGHVFAQDTAFTYQGRLTNTGDAATGQHDMQFKLYDTMDVGSGTQHGGTITNPTVQVTDGVFTVQLDFALCATCFDGTARYLEISIRAAGSADPYTVLSPRQPVSSTPYAVRSLSSTSADGLSVACVNCVTGSQIQSVDGSQITGAIPVESVPTGSGNYIQNATLARQGKNGAQQPASFNIEGDGVVGGMISGNTVNAQTAFNLNGIRILSDAGVDNLFVGADTGTTNLTGERNAFFGKSAGATNTVGNNNSFFGSSAGAANAEGNANSFYGSRAGMSNTTGSGNSFFGTATGSSNTTGRFNSFFGTQAGAANTDGNNNSLFGNNTGVSNTTGNDNSFFGNNAGVSNTEGTGNSFFGANAGLSGETGNDNVFFGRDAGKSNTGSFNSYLGARAGEQIGSGLFNTFIGYNARGSLDNMSFATAVGAGAVATASNHVQIGRAGGDTVAIGTPGFPASSNHVCMNSDGTLIICASSLRYKTEVLPFHGGLSVIHRLRPIAFTWKEGGLPDIGLAAEEVAELDEQLIFRNPKGEIEGVKYTQLSAFFINAFKEQQTQIQVQQQQIKQQQQQIDALKKLVCQQNQQADICR